MDLLHIAVDKFYNFVMESLNRWKRSKPYMIVTSYNCIYEPENGKDTSYFNMQLSPPIELDSMDYCVGLLDIETNYSFPNVKPSNCNLKYWSVAKGDWVVISFQTGASISLEAELDKNGDAQKCIMLEAIKASSRVKMKITKTEVDFTYENSINKILGFNSQKYGDRTKTTVVISENIIDIIDVNSIYVNCDIISNSYDNGATSTVIYSFFPTVPPNFKIVEKPNPPAYLPVNKKSISGMTVWLTDETGSLISMRGEKVTIRFYLQKIPLT